MDVQKYDGGWSHEDPAEYLGGHSDVGELSDPLAAGAEADETMKRKQKELDRLAEFGSHWERSELRHAGSWTNRKCANQCAIRRPRVPRATKRGYDVFTPSSTQSTGRIIDYLGLEKSCQTCIADVTKRALPRGR